jgi:hypothetical protein
VADDTQKRFKSRADVHMERESQAASFAKRRSTLELTEAEATNIPVPALEKTNKLAWVLTYLAHRIGRKEPLATYDGTGESGVYPLPAQATLALYGDWASGTQIADRIAGHIRARRPEITIHMGDIYFVGDEDEARENFLGIEVPGSPFRAVAYPAGTQRSFAMNGNHEMYARGKGYFRHVLPALGQRASFFALENEHWRVLTLDSGYHSITWPFIELLLKPDCHLPDAVMAWLKEVLGGDPRGTIILTHHQPFSHYEPGFPRLIEQLSTLLGGPVLWLWGHEHWLSIYAPVEAGGMTIHGRCIGHAGMPCEPPGTDRNPAYPILLEDHRILDQGAKVVLWPNGYAMLSFDGAALRIDYRDVNDDLVAHEAWTAQGGRIEPVTAPMADVAGVEPPL